ncbi:MAG: S8 family serine peptidase [Bacteroidales bacterium]|nr:S8 family serine peptidase [Bacteroidales bacterium]
MKNFTKFLILFLFVISFHAYTQTNEEIQRLILPSTNIPVLNQLKNRFSEFNAFRKEEALRKALENGWLIREDYGDVVIELQGLDDNGMPIYNITNNANAAKTVSTNKVYSGGGLGLSLDGANMKAGVWDGGNVLATHQEFNNTGSARIVNKNSVATASHATHVTGTIAAGGVTASAKGMAFKANVDAYDWTDDMTEMATAAANGLLVSNHSYGFVTGWYYSSTESKWYWYGTPSVSESEDYDFGFYDDKSVNADNVAYNAPYYLMVKSSGNDNQDGPTSQPVTHYVYNGGWVNSTTVRPLDGGTNGWDCISSWGNAKNLLTVGAVDDIPNGYTQPSDVTIATFSSRGPTDDGRIKPDIVANGMGLYSTNNTSTTSYTTMNGTSMSTPNTTGSLLLLQEHNNETHGSYMRAATLKALVIHTADESGANEGPDYVFGWGLLNTAKAASAISNKNISTFIKEESLSNGTTYTLNVTATGTEPLIATIVWADPAGTSPAPSLDPVTKMLVNDLDLRISKSPTTYYPYKLDGANPANAATKEDNSIDNVEKVFIASPEIATYTITVTHKGSLSSGPQAFSLIVTGITNGYPVVTTDAVSNILKTSAQIDGTVHTDAGNTVTERGFVYNTTGNPTLSDSKKIAGNGTGAFSAQLTGLTGNQTYYVRAYATNSTGTSYGEELNFTTLCETITLFPYIQAFDASTSCPTCWSVFDNQGNGQVWQFGTFTGKVSGSAGNVAYLNSDGYGTGNSQNSDLISTTFDFSGYTNVNLSFKHYYRHYASTATLYYSTNNGTSWTQVQQWTATFTSNPTPFNQTFAALDNQAQVKFRWQYTGTYGWYWSIDSIKVTATAANSLIVSNETHTVDANMAYQNVTVEPDGNLTIDENKILTVTGNLLIESDASGSGSFIDKGTLLVQGNTFVEKFIPATTYGRTVSSPVETAPLSIFSGHVATYFWHPLTTQWTPFNSGNLELGRGYWTKFPTDNTLSFSDNLNSSDFTFNNLYRTGFQTGNCGWNFIGNPYPSAIDWDLVIALNNGTTDFVTNTKVNAAVYVSNNNNSYNSYVNSVGTGGFDGIIPPATAFWVQVNSAYINATNPIAGASILLNNDVRVHANQGAKSSTANNILRLYIQNDEFSDDALIRLHTDASDDFDPNFDALKFMAENENLPQIYSILDDASKLSINSIPDDIKGPVSIPLGVYSGNNGTHNLIFESTGLDQNLSLHLEDKNSNSLINLKQENTYQFQMTDVTEDNRFILHIGLTALTNNQNLLTSIEPNVYMYNNTLYVSNPDASSSLRIFNLTGQELYSKLLDLGISMHKLDVPAGIYIVKIAGQDKIKTVNVFVY